MKKILLPTLMVLVLSACSSTSGTKATVDDRTGSKAPAATPSTPVAGTGSTSGTDTSGLAGRGAAGSALDGAGSGDPRKDPASPLSQRSVFFDFDQYVVKDEYRAMLDAHAGYLKSKGDARVILQGHADERGSREYNLALGQKRAEAVRKALSVMGVSDSQMEAISFGEEKPRMEGDSEEAHAANRRTDIVYSDE